MGLFKKKTDYSYYSSYSSSRRRLKVGRTVIAVIAAVVVILGIIIYFNFNRIQFLMKGYSWSTTSELVSSFDNDEEKELLSQNVKHKDWQCTEELMKTTKNGKAIYLHCLPADISGVSCESGEVEASVFDRYRNLLYKEASYKPYIIASMIFLSKMKNPQEALRNLEIRGIERYLK